MTKIQLPTSFSTPCRKNFDPPPPLSPPPPPPHHPPPPTPPPHSPTSSFNPPPTKISTPTSILTIRSLGRPIGITGKKRYRYSSRLNSLNTPILSHKIFHEGSVKSEPRPL